MVFEIYENRFEFYLSSSVHSHWLRYHLEEMLWPLSHSCSLIFLFNLYQLNSCAQYFLYYKKVFLVIMCGKEMILAFAIYGGWPCLVQEPHQVIYFIFGFFLFIFGLVVCWFTLFFYAKFYGLIYDKCTDRFSSLIGLAFTFLTFRKPFQFMLIVNMIKKCKRFQRNVLKERVSSIVF